MSYLIATVTNIIECDMLHLVEFKSNNTALSMISLDLMDNITIGKKVQLTMKPSHIVIAKEFNGDISYSNRLDCTIISIDNGAILSSIRLDFFGSILEAIITFKSSKSMNLKEGDKVTAMINATELSITEVF